MSLSSSYLLMYLVAENHAAIAKLTAERNQLRLDVARITESYAQLSAEGGSLPVLLARATAQLEQARLAHSSGRPALPHTERFQEIVSALEAIEPVVCETCAYLCVCVCVLCCVVCVRVCACVCVCVPAFA